MDWHLNGCFDSALMMMLLRGQRDSRCANPTGHQMQLLPHLLCRATSSFQLWQHRGQCSLRTMQPVGRVVNAETEVAARL